MQPDEPVLMDAEAERVRSVMRALRLSGRVRIAAAGVTLASWVAVFVLLRLEPWPWIAVPVSVSLVAEAIAWKIRCHEQAHHGPACREYDVNL